MSLKDIRKVFKTELDALKTLEARIDGSFLRALDLLENCRGRVVLTGIGKSGIIAHKISATFSSTGTPSVYLNAAEAIHGDLGFVQRGDLVIMVSRSGSTDEVHIILSQVKLLGVPVIGILGNVNSTLAEKCDIALDASVKEEACPFDLAPTASTTAALVVGDALAVALLKRKGFQQSDFAFLHPGGSLGKRLTVTIADIMHTGADIPVVSEEAKLQNVIVEMTSKMLGVTCVSDAEGKLSGIITDGDLRRLLKKTTELNGVSAMDIMTTNPKTIRGDALATRGINFMEKYSITQLVVTDGEGHIQGIVHLHDLIRAGIT